MGALLILGSTALAGEPSNNATGALGAGQKAEGVCSCNTVQDGLVKKNSDRHNKLLPDGYQPAGSAAPGNGASEATGTQ